MKKKLLFVFNPKSGKGLIKEHLVNIVDIMTKAGYKITIYPTQCQGDAIKKVMKNAEKYDLVVCSGGDGTLDEVVTGMEQSEVNVPIGYILRAAPMTLQTLSAYQKIWRRPQELP